MYLVQNIVQYVIYVDTSKCPAMYLISSHLNYKVIMKCMDTNIHICLISPIQLMVL